ncbi:MAG: peptide chain release factor 1 [Deltaproteobacteria bacterium]|nr:peptide chain release factor 1 [Deltaproteobacteria bacterium]
MFDRLAAIEERFEKLEGWLGDPQVASRPEELQRHAREHADLARIVEPYREYRRIEAELKTSRALLEEGDEAIRELAREEIALLEGRRAELEARLKELLIPRDPNDARDIILEIRAGAGGEEAALFAADLLRMFIKYAESQRWRVEIMSTSGTGSGGYKEVIASIAGRGAYSRLKYESGVHRVQRVPVTESQGRIHTSTVTVAILPEPEEVEVAIDPKELRIDVFRSSGPGGQSVNTTDSAVRVTHLPTGLVVSCQDEKSQHKNKAKALRVLRARLLDLAQEEQRQQISEARRTQVGTGDRSERIRTYNFPQGRVTDHRIGLTLHRLEDVLEGDLAPLIEALIAHYQAEALKAAS